MLLAPFWDPQTWPSPPSVPSAHPLPHHSSHTQEPIISVAGPAIFPQRLLSMAECVKMFWEVDSGVPNSAQAAPSALCTPLGRCPVLPYFTDLRGFWTGSSSLWSPARCWEQQPHRPADRQETMAGWLVSPAIPTFPTLPSKTLHLSGHISLSGLRHQARMLSKLLRSLGLPHLQATCSAPTPSSWAQKVKKGVISRICLRFRVTLLPRPLHFRPEN